MVSMALEERMFSIDLCSRMSLRAVCGPMPFMGSQ